MGRPLDPAPAGGILRGAEDGRPVSFLELFFDKKDKSFKVNWDDEIIKGTLVAKDGRLVHPSLSPQPAA